MTAHDQLPVIVLAAGPARDPGGDDLLRQLIEFGAVLSQCSFKFEARLRERAPSDPRIEKIGGFRKCR